MEISYALRVGASGVAFLLMFGIAQAGALQQASAAYKNGDYAGAVHLWRPLVEQGNTEAIDVLFSTFHQGWNRNSQFGGQDVAEEEKWRSALEEAKVLLRGVADKGDAGVQFQLAELLDNTGDFAEALTWYRKSAEQDNLDAMYGIYRFYQSGDYDRKGVDAINGEGEMWKRKADDIVFNRKIEELKLNIKRKDTPETEYALGAAYTTRVGGATVDDIQEAITWVQKSADQNYPEALYLLGKMYSMGQGVKEDMIQAYVLFHLAAMRTQDTQLKSAALANRANATLFLSQEQLKQAQELARTKNPDPLRNQ